MLHCIKYEFIALFRNKIVIFWLLGFPVILGTLFFAAFSSLADSEDTFTRIPIAVIKGENTPEALITMLESLSEGEDGLFEIKTFDEEQAKELMGSGELQAIIYTDGEISMVQPAGSSIGAALVKAVLDSCKSQSAIIEDIAREHPENLQKALESIGAEIAPVAFTSNSANNDPYIQYFYNLLAMSGLFGSMMGMYCAINHQANLSSLGARIETSPISKLKDIFSSMIATLLVHTVLINIAAAYLIFILGIDFGVSFGFVVLINFVSCVLGDSLGCFIGSIGKAKEGIKISILVAVSLSLCFFSGLMASNMYLLIEESFPLFNRINPAALIVNCFYSLCVYGGYEKLAANILILAVWCVLFIAASVLMTRKRKYKSI